MVQNERTVGEQNTRGLRLATTRPLVETVITLLRGRWFASNDRQTFTRSAYDLATSGEAHEACDVSAILDRCWAIRIRRRKGNQGPKEGDTQGRNLGDVKSANVETNGRSLSDARGCGQD